MQSNILPNSLNFCPIRKISPSKKKKKVLRHNMALPLNFLQFPDIFGGQSKLTEKLKNSAFNIFLVVNEPEDQKFSLKNSKFQQILGPGWRFHGIFSSFQIFLAGNNHNSRKNSKTQL
jgi:hypothetical protein